MPSLKRERERQYNLAAKGCGGCKNVENPFLFPVYESQVPPRLYMCVRFFC